MKVRDVIRMIEDDGWYFERQQGSHRIYRHAEKPVPSPSPAGRAKTCRRPD
jgi:predicted RNA binding protein YcfA (HicA-like mRNA interferase family)